MDNMPVPQQPSSLAAWGANNPFQAIINTLGNLPTPEPRAGFVMPFPILKSNFKETINGRTSVVNALASEDADDADTYLITSPKLRKPYMLFTPIFGTVRHTAWRNNQRVIELPNSLGPCQYCQSGFPTGNDQDRCDTTCELVVAAIEGNPHDPSSLRVNGLYLVPAKATSFEEVYNFYFYRVMGNIRQGLAPWSNIFMLTYQHISSKRLNREWNVYRMVRVEDNAQAQKWHKEGRNADGTPEVPNYMVSVTPDHIVADLNQRFMNPASIEARAIMMLGRSQNDTAIEIRKMIAGRPRPQLQAPQQQALMVQQPQTAYVPPVPPVMQQPMPMHQQVNMPVVPPPPPVQQPQQVQQVQQPQQVQQVQQPQQQAWPQHQVQQPAQQPVQQQPAWPQQQPVQQPVQQQAWPQQAPPPPPPPPPVPPPPVQQQQQVAFAPPQQYQQAPQAPPAPPVAAVPDPSLPSWTEAVPNGLAINPAAAPPPPAAALANFLSQVE